MDAPLSPPLKPMLARRAEQLPVGAAGTWRYEPKLDGIRALAFIAGDAVTIQSRAGNPLQSFFPELVSALARDLDAGTVIDAEIVVADEQGTSFRAAMSRLGLRPERAARAARQKPAVIVAFDLLALDGARLLSEPLSVRRALLERAVPAAAWHLSAALGLCAAPKETPGALHLMPQTEDARIAQAWFDHLAQAGVEGIVAKRSGLPYRPGRREMVKVKRNLPGGR